MRTSVASLALIRRRGPNGAEQYLCNWNEKWGRLNFVGGHKLDSESFRECCAREVHEELGIIPDVDFRVAGEASHHLEYEAHSRGAGEVTKYIIEMFEVELLGEGCARRISEDPTCAWVDAAAIRAATADDGRPISDTVGRLLTKARLLD